ncbi:MAG: hypothetical protein Rubg2KO_23380 [Rubricoccaceae bacterium]
MIRWFAVLLIGLAPVAHAQFGGEGLPDLSGVAAAISAASPSAAPSGTFRSGMDVPSLDPGAAATDLARQLRASVEAEAGPQPAMAQLEAQMPLILSAVETQLEGVGFAKRDFGVAAAYAFIYLWETAQNESIPEDPSAVAARTVGTAMASHWGPAYSAMAPAQQETAYETLLVSTTLLTALEQQYEAAGAMAEAEQMRSAAATTFAALFGVPPSQVSVDAEGRIDGLATGSDSGLAIPSAAGPPAPPPAPRQVTSSASVTNPQVDVASALPAASANGAEVYMKYTWGYGMNGIISRQEPLILFPDGTAIEDMPESGVREFTSSAIAAAFEDDRDRERTVGTWQRAGDRITLRVDGETRVLRKTPRGWWDDDDPINNETGYDTYFPIVLATPGHMLGPWVTQSLFVSGMAGGASPQVSAGSTTNRVFYADGTFAEDRESFASATTASMGDAFNTGGDVGVFSENSGQAAGRWRIDGPLMTLEKDGQRRIVLAFIMPEWSADNPNSDTWVGTDFWERPDEDE